MPIEASHYDVLISGAGPVGLSLAVELGMRGVTCLVVERNDRVGYSPRAKTTNVRSREHLRRWGIADALRQASPMPPDYPPNIVFATRMNGPELARFDNAFNGVRERNELYSEEAQWVPQYTVEEVLRRHAVSLPGVTLAFNTELVRLDDDGDQVAADIKNLETGVEQPITCSYLVGADGARSMVRTEIGATLSGDSPPMKNCSVIFRAPDFDQRHPHGPAIMYWLVNDDMPSILGPMDEHGLWYFMATKLADDPDPAESIAMIRRSTGIADLDIEVVRTDPWIARCLIADFYSKGRVFLAGDACHLHPPFGGFGMNMGIGDAVDLGWKLAATLQGWGGPEMLASYETERRPVHLRTMAEAAINYGVVGNQLQHPDLEAASAAGEAARREVGATIARTKVREFRTLGLVLGYRYQNSAILVSDGTEPPPEHFMNYVPSASPGCLAPHRWLADGSSLYDHFGPGFTLLALDDAGDTGAIQREAAAQGMPLTVFAPQEAGLSALYQARFALIRPDQHVAWRGDQLTDVGQLLERVTGHSQAGPIEAADAKRDLAAVA